MGWSGQACVRCSLLRPDPAQRPRPTGIRYNLIARIAEAEREGWLGEVEGLQVGLAGAQGSLDELDAEAARRPATVDLGMPTFADIVDRTTTSTDQHCPILGPPSQSGTVRMIGLLSAAMCPSG